MTSDLSADMVEATAKAIYGQFILDGNVDDQWRDLKEGQGYWCNSWARPALAAALATGEVREEWRLVEDGVDVWAGPTASRSYVMAAYQRVRQRRPTSHVEHRTVHSFSSGHILTAPWKEVND